MHFYFEVTKNFRNFQKNVEETFEGLFEPKLPGKTGQREGKRQYNLPLLAEVRSCEWPCEDFLKEAGIHEDFHALIETAGLTGFINDRIEQYLLLTNTFVQNFYYYPKKSPPSVSFHLYDEFREMSLRNFCAVCRIPFEGKLEEPHRRDVDDFV